MRRTVLIKPNYFTKVILSFICIIVIRAIMRGAYLILINQEIINPSLITRNSWDIYFLLSIIVIVSMINIIRILFNKPSGHRYILIENRRYKRCTFYISLLISIISLRFIIYRFDDLLLFIVVTSFMILLLEMTMLRNADGVYKDCIYLFGRKIFLTNIIEVKEYKHKVKILAKGKFLFVEVINDYNLQLDKQEMIKLNEIIEGKKFG
jgi:hypothetical protein